jgi:hypothetical protein
MNDTEESEDYQAVGVKCRDALIALGKEHAAAEWVGDVNNPPKAADFKGWANVFADRLSEAGPASVIPVLESAPHRWRIRRHGTCPCDVSAGRPATGRPKRNFQRSAS